MIIVNETRRGFIMDARLVWHVSEHTPSTSPINPKSERDAFLTPGCNLKSIERRGAFQPPKYFGVLAEINAENDTVCVMGKPMPGERLFVWIGTQAEYDRVWRCD